MRSNSEDARHNRSQMHAMRFETGILGDAAVTLDFATPQVLTMTPTAARVVTLPADDATKRGHVFFLKNAAAATHAITVNNAAAAAVGTLDATQSAVIWLDHEGNWIVQVGAST